MSTDLRSGLIRLAFANPELRADLLPLIEKEAATKVHRNRSPGEVWKTPNNKYRAVSPSGVAKSFDTPDEAKAHAGKGGGKSEKKDEGKKDEGGAASVSLPAAESKKLGEVLSQWHSSGNDPLYAVSSHANAGKPIPADAAKKALDKVTFMLENADDHRLSNSDKKQLSSAKKMLEKAVGGGKSKPKSEKPKASFKKNYRPTMESVMTKHNLTDDDAAEVIKFSIDRPKKGKEQSPAELMRRFMEHAKPETKERMKGMNPAEFMKMLRAVLDDEEGGTGKTASLRAGLIRLAYTNPELRPTLLPLIEKHAEDEGDMAAVLEAEADPTSHDQNLPEHYYFGKTAEERLENIEKMLSQFASPASKDQNKPQSYYGLPPKGKQASTSKVAANYDPTDGDFNEQEAVRDEIVAALAKKFKGVKDSASLNAFDVGNNHYSLHGEWVSGHDNDLKTRIQVPTRAKYVAAIVKAVVDAEKGGKQASVKTAGGSGAANAAFLRQSPLKDKVLRAVAKHYGTSVAAIEAELTDPDAEAVFEYIGNDAALQMQVYREFKSKGYR